jgi:hypothetical protein
VIQLAQGVLIPGKEICPLLISKLRQYSQPTGQNLIQTIHSLIMKDKSKAGVSRRKFLPMLSSLFLPFAVLGKAKSDIGEQPDQSYQTMLTKDGKVVKVRSKTINDSKIVDKQLSNRSLLSWLKKTDKDL